MPTLSVDATRRLALTGLLALAACTTAPTAADDARPDAQVPDISSADVADDVPAHTPRSTDAVQADALRRLSVRELGHALHDLYGLEPDLSALPAEADSLGFTNDRRGQFSTTGLIDGQVSVFGLVADTLVRTRPDLFDCDLDAVSDQELPTCLGTFVDTQGTRLFRRPPSDQTRAAFLGLLDELPADADAHDRAVLLLQAMLLSPDFLVLDEQPADPQAAIGEPVRVDGYTLATRLAAFLWESVPDDTLLAEAASGALDTPEGVATAVDRMLQDPRARRTQARFLYSWLNLDKLEGLSKAPEDGLDASLRQASQEELRRFVDEVLIADDAPFLDVLRSTDAVVDPRLAELYGTSAPQGWSRVSLPDRPGLLTRFGFLAAHGHPDRPSPVLRGVTLNNRLLCVDFPPPPANAEAAAAAVAEEVDLDSLTNREQYELTTMQGDCSQCHARINPVGYALEGFDTMGRARTVEDNGRTIDTSAEIDALQTRVDGASDMMLALAASPTVHECAARHWLRFAGAGGTLEHDTSFRTDLATAIGAELPFADVMRTIATDPRFARVVVEDR